MKVLGAPKICIMLCLDTLSIINYAVKSGESEDADILSVTLCGSAAAVANYMMRDQEATHPLSFLLIYLGGSEFNILTLGFVFYC